MAHTPFDEVPKKTFFIKMLAPAAAFFAISFASLGVFIGGGSPIQSAVQQRKEWVQLLVRIPSYCWTGATVNTLQTERCSDLWTQLGMATALTSIPWVAVLIFYLLAFGQLDTLYRRGRTQLKKGKILFKVIVISPGELPADLFAWVFGFRLMVGQSPQGESIKVYVPQSSIEPRIGEQLAVLDGGIALGQKRYLGLIYAPHIAVVLGTKG